MQRLQLCAEAMRSLATTEAGGEQVLLPRLLPQTPVPQGLGDVLPSDLTASSTRLRLGSGSHVTSPR